MTDTEGELPFDDSEVEITDLDQPARAIRPRGLRLTPRQRRWSMALTSVLFVLVVGALLASTADVRGLLSRTLFAPQPTPVSPDLSFYLRGNPSWGQFTVDGRRVVSMPEPKYDKPLVLVPGIHRITWQVAHFQPLTCIFDVENATTLKSPCLTYNKIIAYYLPDISPMIIAFFASLNDMPANQRASLVQQIQASLSYGGSGGSEKVYPGEAYAVSDQQAGANPALCTLIRRVTFCYARAHQPLQATLNLQMDTSTSPTDPCAVSEQCSLSDQDCRAFCNDPALRETALDVEGWNVIAVVRLSWTYTTLSGKVIARDQPDTAFRGVEDYQMLSLHIDDIHQADQSWLIIPGSHDTASGFNDPLCTQALQDTNELIDISVDVPPTVAVQQSLSSGTSLLGDPDVGCLEIAGQPIGGAPLSTANTVQMAYCLVRFGVVLAANETAHQFWPSLPIVDAYEKNVVQNLLTLLPA